MPRAARKAPDREPDPLDAYSTWDIRIAKVIYYGLIIATAIVVLGIWIVIITGLIPGAAWTWFIGIELGFKIAIIAAIVTGHAFLLVLFYTLFRGGMVKLCNAMFKDRRLAKKWEDYSTLRLLIGIALFGLYVTI
ncbi:MAG: hypothetical protein ACFFDN_50285, partial [Candidatus Hodarchaeota archaeon]